MPEFVPLSDVRFQEASLGKSPRRVHKLGSPTRLRGGRTSSPSPSRTKAAQQLFTIAEMPKERRLKLLEVIRKGLLRKGSTLRSKGSNSTAGKLPMVRQLGPPLLSPVP